MALIYLITNMVNGKKYIGFTTQCIEVRLRQHIYFSKVGTTKLAKAIRKYGKTNFTIIELERSDEDLFLLSEREPFWIKKYNSVKCGYNSTCGGENYIFCDEVLKKLSNKAKERVGHKNNFYGKHHSNETKSLIGSVHRGKKMSESAKQKISEANSMIFEVMFPNGKREIIKNLLHFCGKHGLHSSCMCAVYMGRRKHHKGFSIKKLEKW